MIRGFLEARGLPRRAHAVHVGTVCLGVLMLLAAASLIVAPVHALRAPIDLGAFTWPAALAFAGLFFALQQQGFVFRWRDETTKISLDEIALFLGVLVLAPAIVVLAVAASSLATQIVHRRDLVKASFNVAQYALAAAAAVSVTAMLRTAGVPPPWGAVAAPLVFAFATPALVSLLFAGMEASSPVRVFRSRFLGFSLIGASLGVSLGVIVVALAHLSVFALLAAVPVFAYLRHFGRLSEWADDELKVHQLLGSVSVELAGRSDLDLVAARVLRSCHELFACGEAHMTLDEAGAGVRFWRESFEGGSLGYGGVAADVIDVDGRRIGSIGVFPKHAQHAYGEREHHLLRAVAGSVAGAAANAQALRAKEAADARQRETIKRLENANRELEQFTLWTTHDMREPLRSIGTMATFLHEDIGTIPTDEAREMAARISGGADRLKERVKALHAFSRIVQQDVAFEDVDMAEVARHVMTSLEAKVHERRARVVVSPGLPVVRAQPHRVDQVLANLLENAIKYGAKPGDAPIIEVGCEESPTEWRFFVRDHGPGIPPAYQDRVFLLFQRGPQTSEPGSGAGLAIVKRIAEQHGGRAWLDSAEGAGATFWFSIPREAPRAVEVRPSPAAARKRF